MISFSVFSILGDYGWYILGSSIVLGYIYHTFIKEKIEAYWQKKEEQDYAAKYHKSMSLPHKILSKPP